MLGSAQLILKQAGKKYMMEKFIENMKQTNTLLDMYGLQNVRTFMFAKTFIGIERNFLGDPVFVCKLPSHIIRTQVENPDFKISGFYKKSKLIALMIKVYDLKNAPYIIISNFVPLQTSKVKKVNIKAVSFINEVNEPILDVEVEEVVNLPYSTDTEFECLLSKNDLLLLPRTEGVSCKTLCTNISTLDNKYFVQRDTDKGDCNLHILASEISSSGENAVHGHGKRLEDMIHFQASALRGANALCGVKYAMDPKKSTSPSEELCDELITYRNFSIFIQEKSIITKPRFRKTHTIQDSIDTAIKRISQAAEQLCKHIKSVKSQNNSIHTVDGEMDIPNEVIGIIVISESFEGNDYNNKIRKILYSNSILSDIRLNIMSAEEFCWMVICSEGRAGVFISTLIERFDGFIRNGRYGVVPCSLSISCRVANRVKNE